MQELSHLLSHKLVCSHFLLPFWTPEGQGQALAYLRVFLTA